MSEYSMNNLNKIKNIKRSVTKKLKLKTLYNEKRLYETIFMKK